MSPHPVDVHVGKRLRLRRTMLGMSQESLGVEIGVTFQQIQKYERGINRIGSSRLYELSNILEVPVEFFFEEYANISNDNGERGYAGMAESKSPGFGTEQLTNRETLELIRAYYKIKSPQARKKVFELVKAMAASAAAEEE